MAADIELDLAAPLAQPAAAEAPRQQRHITSGKKVLYYLVATAAGLLAHGIHTSPFADCPPPSYNDGTYLIGLMEIQWQVDDQRLNLNIDSIL